MDRVPQAGHFHWPDAKRLGAVLDSARRAHLGGGLEPADPGERPSVVRCLLLQQPQELSPPRVVHGPGQPGAREPGYGQVLGVDRLVVADQPKSRLVRVIEPGLADLAVQDRHPVPGPGPVRGAFLLAAQGALCPRQMPLFRSAGTSDWR